MGIQYINPFSNKFNALKEFRKIDESKTKKRILLKTAITVIAFAIIGFGIGGIIAGVLAFRKMVKNHYFKVQKLNGNPEKEIETTSRKCGAAFNKVLTREIGNMTPEQKVEKAKKMASDKFISEKDVKMADIAVEDKAIDDKDNLEKNPAFKRFVLTILMGKELDKLSPDDRKQLVTKYAPYLLLGEEMPTNEAEKVVYAKKLLAILPDDLKKRAVLDFLPFIYTGKEFSHFDYSTLGNQQITFVKEFLPEVLGTKSSEKLAKKLMTDMPKNMSAIDKKVYFRELLSVVLTSKRVEEMIPPPIGSGLSNPKVEYAKKLFNLLPDDNKRRENLEDMVSFALYEKSYKQLDETEKSKCVSLINVGMIPEQFFIDTIKIMNAFLEFSTVEKNANVLFDTDSVSNETIDFMKKTKLEDIKYQDTENKDLFKVVNKSKSDGLTFISFSNRNPTQGELRGNILREKIDMKFKEENGTDKTLYEAITELYDSLLDSDSYTMYKSICKGIYSDINQEILDEFTSKIVELLKNEESVDIEKARQIYFDELKRVQS